MEIPRLDQALVRSDLGEVVAEHIKQLILAGELKAGEHLVENDFAHRFGTSRGPVREALSMLERRGLVTARPRRGFVVTTVCRSDVIELFSLRRVLEGLAVRDLLRSSSWPDTVETLWSRVHALDAAHATGDRLQIGIADMALHREIVVGSHHRRLLESWERLADETLLLMTELSSLDSVLQGPAGDHREIVEAIASGHPDVAGAALDAHLRTAEAVILSSLERGTSLPA